MKSYFPVFSLLTTLCLVLSTRSTIPQEFYTKETLPKKLTTIFEFLRRVEHDYDDPRRSGFLDGYWDQFVHPSDPSVYVAYSKKYSCPEKSKMIQNWMSVQEKSHQSDFPAMPVISLIVTVQNNSEYEIVVFYSRYEKDIVEGHQDDQSFRIYYNQPASFFKVYVQMFSTYAKLNLAGFQSSNLSVSSFSYVMSNGTFSDSDEMTATDGEFPKYNILYTSFMELIPLTERSRTKVNCRSDPLRISGKVIKSGYMDRVEMFSLAIDILAFEAQTFSKLFESQKTGRKKVASTNPYAGDRNKQSGITYMMDNFYKEESKPFYRDSTLKTALNSISANSGNLSLKITNKKPIQTLSLNFLVEMLEIIIMDYNESEFKSVFDYVSLKRDYMYLVECTVVMFRQFHVSLQGVTVVMKNSLKKEVTVNVLNEIVAQYKNFFIILSKLIQSDLTKRPSAFEIRNSIWSLQQNTSSLLEAHHAQKKHRNLMLL